MPKSSEPAGKPSKITTISGVIALICFGLIHDASAAYFEIKIEAFWIRLIICAVGLLSFAVMVVDRLNQTYGIEGLEDYRAESAHQKNYTLRVRNPDVVKTQPKPLLEKKNE